MQRIGLKVTAGVAPPDRINVRGREKGKGVEKVAASGGAQRLVELVRNKLRGHLYHVTDEANLPSIEQHGLLSARSRQGLGVEPVFHGGNELSQTLDLERGLDGYAFLSFFSVGLMPKHEDARRRRVRLAIDAGILYGAGVQVALGRANSVRTRIYRPARAVSEMDWEIVEGHVGEEDLSWKARYLRVCDYEILVPDRVPLEYILGIEVPQPPPNHHDRSQ